MGTILIVEDEHLLGKSLRDGLAYEGHEAAWVTSAEQALMWLGKRTADVALIDVRLSGQSGLDLLGIATDRFDVVCIVMTADGNDETAVEAAKMGAYEFLIKPVDLDTISSVVHRALRQRGLRHLARDRTADGYRR